MNVARDPRIAEPLAARRWVDRRSHRWLVLGLALLTASCRKCGGDPKEEAPLVVDDPPVPAPAKLVADVYVGAPNSTWQKLQRVVGGPAGILPTTIGGIAATALGLDPAIGQEVDGASPAFAVLVGEPSSPHWALALKLVDVRRARSAVFDAETARFAPKESGGFTHVVGKMDGKSTPFPAAFSRNDYLVLAAKAADIDALGPYVTRTLPRQPLPAAAIAVDLPRASVQEILAPAMADAWSGVAKFLMAEDQKARASHGGRAPDFGDPSALVAAVDGLVQKRLAIVKDLDRARIELDVGDDGILGTMTMTPQASGPARAWVDGMRVGDVAPLTQLPLVSAVALMTRDGEEARGEQAEMTEKALLASFGGKLEGAAEARLREAVRQTTAARGDVLTGALLWDEPQGIVVRAPVRDAAAANGAVRGFLELTKGAPFKEMLHVREVMTSSETLEPWGAVGKAVVVRGATKATRTGAPKEEEVRTGVAWTAARQDFVLATGTGNDAVANLRTGGGKEPTLANDPAVVRALAPLGNEASSVLLVQPLRFDTSRANLPIAPAVLAVGRHDKDAFVRISLTPGVLREVSRRLLGF